MQSYQARLFALIIMGLVPLLAMSGLSGEAAAQQTPKLKAAPVILKRTEAEQKVSQLRASAAKLRALANGEQVKTSHLNRRRTMSDFRGTEERMPMQAAQTLRQAASELEAKAAEWEKKLKDKGDDAQLSEVELQTMVKKMQQSLQSMSNVSKSTHDTAMAVIRNIG